jgi:hypothetical protein
MPTSIPARCHLDHVRAVGQQQLALRLVDRHRLAADQQVALRGDLGAGQAAVLADLDVLPVQLLAGFGHGLLDLAAQRGIGRRSRSIAAGGIVAAAARGQRQQCEQGEGVEAAHVSFPL